VIITPAARGFIGGVGSLGLVFSNPAVQLPNAVGVVSSAISSAGGTASISGGISPQVSANGTTWGSTATIAPGGIVYARSNAPSGWGAFVTVTVTVGAKQGTFAVLSCTEPTFSFPAISGAAPGTAAATVSQPTGCNLGGTVTLTSSASTGPTASPNPVMPLGNLVVNYIGRAGWGLSDTIGVSLNGYTASFAVSTPPLPAFIWGSSQSVMDATGAGTYANNTLKFAGIAGNYTFSAIGTGSPQVSRDGVNWYSSMTLTPADNSAAWTTTPTSLGTTSSTSGAAISLTPAVDCPVGSLLIVCVQDGSRTLSTGVPVLSSGDTLLPLNNVWLPCDNAVNNGSANWFYCYTSVDLPVTDSISYTKNTSGSNASMAAYFFSAGATDGNAPATKAIPTYGFSTSPLVGITPTQKGITLGFVAANKRGVTWVDPGLPWANNFPDLAGTSSISPLVSYYQISTSGGAVTCNPTCPSDTMYWAAFAVSFNPPTLSSNWLAVRVLIPASGSNAGSFTLSYGNQNVALGTFTVAA